MAGARDEERAQDAGCYLLDLVRVRVGLSLEFQVPVPLAVVAVDTGLP